MLSFIVLTHTLIHASLPTYANHMFHEGKVHCVIINYYMALLRVFRSEFSMVMALG